MNERVSLTGAWMPITLLVMGLAGCGAPEPPEASIRAWLAEAEALAEARQAPALRELIADDYGDPAGRDAGELRRLLHGYLLAHPSIHLLTRINEIQVDGRGNGRARLTIGMLGRNAPDAGAWDLAAEVHELELFLSADGDDWRVTSARWQRGN